PERRGPEPAGGRRVRPRGHLPGTAPSLRRRRAARGAGRGRHGHPVSRERMFPLRSVVLGAFVPSLVFEVGIGVMLPIVAITATLLGASLAWSGTTAAPVRLRQ